MPGISINGNWFPSNFWPRDEMREAKAAQRKRAGIFRPLEFT